MDDVMRGDSVTRRFMKEEHCFRAMVDGVGGVSATGGSLADKAMREVLDGGSIGRAEREAFGGGVTGEAMREALRASLADYAATEARPAGHPGAATEAVRATLSTGVAVNRPVDTTARGRKEIPEPIAERRHSARVQVHAPGEPIDSPAALGARIRAARKVMRMNQQRFADLAGVGRRFLSEVEAGKPGAEFGKVLACCAAAGIDLFARTR